MRPTSVVALVLVTAALVPVALTAAIPPHSAAAGSLAAAASTATVAASASTVAAAPLEAPIPVYLDGLPVDFDVPPALVAGRTLVPFRLLAEALGCEVEWDEANLRVAAVDPYSARTVDLWIGRADARVNGEPRSLDVPAQIIGDRTLIPLRFFGEALGAGVVWHDDTRSITVTSPRRPMEVLGYYALGNAETSSWTELFGQPYPEFGVGLTDLVAGVACAWFVLDPTTGLVDLSDSYSGQKRPDNWRDILSRCDAYAIETDMMVHWARTTDGVTTPSIYAFLRDPVATRRAVDEIAGYARDFRGVNLDIEGLGQRQTGEDLAATKRDFIAFARLLSDALHARGLELTLSLHPLNSWYPGYDWPSLAPLADRIVIMAYGYGPFSAPQPLTQVTEAIDLALQVVPKEKLLLGLLATRGTNGLVGGETPESLEVKVGLAKRRGIAGIALWRLGVWGEDRLEVIRGLVSRPPAFAIP